MARYCIRLYVIGVINIQELPDYLEGQVIVVKNYQGRPIAIGKLVCSVAAIKMAAIKKGKAVKIMHYFGDELWSSGTELVKIPDDIKDQRGNLLLTFRANRS